MVALSTTEAENIALTEALKEALWFDGFVKELKLQSRIIIVKCNSQSVIYLSRNSTYHKRAKYIDVTMHFAMKKIESKEIKMTKVLTDRNVKDIITKSFSSSSFSTLYTNLITNICMKKDPKEELTL